MWPYQIDISIIFSILCVAPIVLGVNNRKNVLLILIDDLRPALGCYGDKNAYTPNIDKLAERSTLFTNAYAQQALCGPSRTSLLTSRSPHHLSQYDVHQYWRSSAGNFTSLPQFFRENDYIAVSVGKIFHPGVTSNYTDDQPYSWSMPPFHPPTEKFKNEAVCPTPGGTSLSKSIVCPVDVRLQPGQTLPDLQSAQAARSYLQYHKTNQSMKPFFLAVGFHKPHIPLKYPRRFLNYHPLVNVTLPVMRWRPPSQPTVAWNPWSDLRRRDDIAALNTTFPWGTLPDYSARLVKQSYYAAVSYIDDLVGQLLTELTVNGFRDNTVIILTSDHGWSLGEHGEWSKYSNYEVSTRVPLLISVPGQEALETNALVELLDVFPTLAELSGIGKEVPRCHDSPSELLCTDGLSLAPLLNVTGPEKFFQTTKRIGAFSLYPRPGNLPTKDPDSDQPRLNEIKIMGYSIRTKYYRYTEWVNFEPHTLRPDWRRVVARELYSHEIDPMENLNLSDRESLKPIQTLLSHYLRQRFS